MMRSRKGNVTIVVIGTLLIFALFFAGKMIFKPNIQVLGETGTGNSVVSPYLTGLTPFAIETLSPLVGVTLTPLPTDFPTHVAETFAAMPTIQPTATSTLAPQLCTFPLAQTTNIDLTPEKYSFSEPKVVLTTDELQPDIVDWLPDNQNALITQFKLIDLGINGYRETIELFNPVTKVTQIYATRRHLNGPPPAWVPGLNAVVYPATNVLGMETTYHLEFTRQLRISRGNPDDIQILADDLPQYSVAVRPDGSQIAYLQDKQLSRLDAGLKILPPASFDRKRWDYLHVNTDYATADYIMAWRPNSSQIFLYNIAYDGLGYTYILDVGTGQLCNLNFKGWALVARWSPQWALSGNH